MKSSSILMLSVIFGLLFGLAPVQAQGENVVYAVLFYSPTCPHCHKVIEEDLPPIQEEFGDQLIVLYINVSTQQGVDLFREAGQILNVPQDQWGGVPTMIIGTTIMISDQQIPSQMPTLVRDGIAAGGIGIPGRFLEENIKITCAWTEATLSLTFACYGT